MRDFNEYKSSVIESQLKGGKKIFDIQLKGVEGRDIEIDGMLARGIVLNHLNDMSTTKDQRGLNVSLETPIKKGNFVKDLKEDKLYLVLSNIDDHYAYKTCTMEFCNQTLNWKGLDKPVPCWCDNSSYGTKGTVDTNLITVTDGKIQFFTQYNEKTAQIKQDMRFIFDNSKESVYKVADVNRVVTGNVLRIIMDKTDYQEGKDDVSNNIAYNSWLENQGELPPTGSYGIKSYDNLMEIKKWTDNIFTIVDENSVDASGVWDITVDLNGSPSDVVSIIEKGDNYIKLMNNGYIGYEIILKFIKGDVTLTQNIKVVR